MTTATQTGKWQDAPPDGIEPGDAVWIRQRGYSVVSKFPAVIRGLSASGVILYETNNRVYQVSLDVHQFWSVPFRRPEEPA